MVQNFPGPYELRFTYTTTIGTTPLAHQQRLNVDLTSIPTKGDAFATINAYTRGGVATPDLATACEAWLTLLAVSFKTTSSFGNIELWKYDPGTFQAEFISAYSPTKVAGDSAAATSDSQQDIMTFRTTEGGVLRVMMMETVGVSVDRLLYPTSIARIDPIMAFVIGSTNWILARDTSYPFSALAFLGGQNEKLFRIRHR